MVNFVRSILTARQNLNLNNIVATVHCLVVKVTPCYTTMNTSLNDVIVSKRSKSSMRRDRRRRGKITEEDSETSHKRGDEPGKNISKSFQRVSLASEAPAVYSVKEKHQDKYFSSRSKEILLDEGKTNKRLIGSKDEHGSKIYYHRLTKSEMGEVDYQEERNDRRSAHRDRDSYPNKEQYAENASQDKYERHDKKSAHRDKCSKSNRELHTENASADSLDKSGRYDKRSAHRDKCSKSNRELHAEHAYQYKSERNDETSARRVEYSKSNREQYTENTSRDKSERRDSRRSKSSKQGFVAEESSDHDGHRRRKRWKKVQKQSLELSSSMRSWEHITPTPDRTNDNGMCFTVMSYNILAQNLAECHPDLYTNCYTHDCVWPNRGRALLGQIICHDADIVCLQEVQEDHWKQHLKPALLSRGYLAVYKKRTGSDKQDGCAILYKRAKFSQSVAVPVQFQQGEILDRDNVGIVLMLRPNPTFYGGHTKHICVATTHLLFNPRRGDVKLAQLMLLLAEIDKVAALKGNNYGQRCENDSSSENCSTVDASETLYCPIVLCGDFNTEPFCDMYKFITEGYIKYKGLVARYICGQSEGRNSGSDMSLSSHLLPAHLAITESCQYRKVLKDRFLMRQVSHNPTVKKVSKLDQPLPLSKLDTIQTTERSIEYKNGDIRVSVENQKTKPHELCVNTYDVEVLGSSGVNVPNVKIDMPRTESESSPHNKLSSGTLNHKLEVNQEQNTSFSCPGINSGRAYHSMGFKSVYRHLLSSPQGLVDEITSQHNRCSCTVDYIFYSNPKNISSLQKDAEHSNAKRSDSDESSIKPAHNSQGKELSESLSRHSADSSDMATNVGLSNHLELVSRYTLLSREQIAETGCLPNSVFPSDHLCLIANFYLR